MMLDGVITNGAVFQQGGFLPLDIAVLDGRIAAIGARAAFASHSVPEIDASGQLVFPAAIDSHFHSRAPSHPEREDFTSATAAAAAGGVTTLIEMPISEPPTTNGNRLRDRALLATQAGIIDTGFYSSSATLRRDDLVSAREAGALAFKAFLQEVPPGRESEFAGLCLPTNGDLLAAFHLLREFDLPCVFHAEDESILRRLEADLKHAGRKDGRAHADSRPDIVEAISVGTLLQLSERFDVHLHVPHVSSAMTASLIREAKSRGVRVTAETCPHYLQFDASALAAHGPYAKCNPPLKDPTDTAALWQGVVDGTIDTLASDHAPFTAEEKDCALDDIWLGPPGIPGVEVLLPFAVGAALNGRLSWSRVGQLLFECPARIFGLWGKKGAILPGFDADIVLYDPRPIGVFDHRSLHCKNPLTARLWDGVPCIGRVTATLLRGNLVFDGEQVVGRPGAAEQARRVTVSTAMA